MSLKYAVLLFVLGCVMAEPPTTVKYVYNSSDLSYLSNGESVEHHTPDMIWLKDLYDHYKWDKFIVVVNNTKCQDELLVYLKELGNGTGWANKIYDASGRYNGQFQFGNDYWLGSFSLCEELQQIKTNHEVPPFPVRFSVAKIRININRQLTPVTRQVNLGQCLPSSCTKEDIGALLAQEPKQGKSVHIVDVRIVPGEYVLFDDIKFRIVGGAALIVTVLIFIASILELVLKNKKSSKKADTESEFMNNNNNNNNSDETPKEISNKEKGTRKVATSVTGVFLKIILCFSAVTNGGKILNVEISKNSITCIHGLRFFSIVWIILVHTYLEIFSIAGNKNMRIVTERTFMYQTISNATFSVDTFFFISGLLVTVTFFRAEAKKTKSTKPQSTCKAVQATSSKFTIMMIYRFFRLTPAYLFVLGVNEVILRYLHSYSVFSPAIIDHISCSNFWWRNALYINNFFPQHEFCMLWSWYIANDTQFYFIASILLLIAVRSDKHLKFAAGALGIFMVSSWITTFIIAIKYEYVARVEEPFALFDQLYDKPWLRIGPYLIGMALGYYLFRINCTLKIKPVVVVTGWVLSLACLASLVYGLGREGIVIPASAFYASLGHTAWGLSLAWITLACVCGYGGPLDGIFSCRLLLPLSRLSYCAYLIHPVFMVFSSFILDGTLHLHNLFAMVIFCGNVVISFISAFLISLAFEAPVVNLLKLIF